MNYEQTLSYLFEKLPMFQRQGKAAYKANLDNTIALDNYLKNPHTSFKTIHVAGTNGKGSTSHLLASVLQEAGLKVGLHTSPHLIDFRERIKVNGAMAEQSFVVDFVERHKPFIENVQPSFFELTVLMAFDYFRMMKVDVAVVEVGMGGRLDSTNIITPLVSVITNISKDHCQFLGNGLKEIAQEKAGIIKPNVPVVIGEILPETQEVFERFAEINDSEIFYSQMALGNTSDGIQHYVDLCTLKGFYQKLNISCAIEVLRVLQFNYTFPISEEVLKMGFRNVYENTGLMGRWQSVSEKPLVVCDTGHNEAGIRFVVNQLHALNKNLHIVWGMVNDKDAESIVSLLPVNAMYYLTKPDIERAMPIAALEKVFLQKNLKYSSHPNVTAATDKAMELCLPNDAVFIGGSTFVVADFLKNNKFSN